jgi:hypothetical protein
VNGIYQVRLSLDEKMPVTPLAWPDLRFDGSAFFPPPNATPR